MERYAKRFVRKSREFGQETIRLVQHFLLPAFQGLKFTVPTTDTGLEGDVFVRGSIQSTKNVVYRYAICMYPRIDKTCVEIIRYKNGGITKLGLLDSWIINASSAKEIVEQKTTLDKLMRRFNK
jgi:hypothetical protein